MTVSELQKTIARQAKAYHDVRAQNAELKKEITKLQESLRRKNKMLQVENDGKTLGIMFLMVMSIVNCAMLSYLVGFMGG